MEQQKLPDSVVVSMKSLIDLRLLAGNAIGSTRKKSQSQQAGNFVSPFRGRGMDFSEVRLYQPGDDIRSIDWRVTARTGKTHTKLYTEERERAVYFVVDTGPGMQFGTQVSFKSVVASKIAGLLAWSSMSHGDRVGGILFSGSEHKELKPAGGKRGVMSFLKSLVEWNYKSFQQNKAFTQSEFEDIVLRLKRVARPGSLIFIISDFSNFDENSQRYLSQIAQHCDVVLIKVYDVLEKSAPPPGSYMLSDGVKSGKFIITGNEIRQKILSEFTQAETKLKKYCVKNGIHFFSVCSTDDLPKHLMKNMQRKSGLF